MVNLREQVSFVHSKDPEAATEKAIQLMKGGIARANQMEDVPIKEMDVYKSVMVIGGGIGGISAALGVANTGTPVYLIESSPSIGGKMAQLDRVFPTDDCAI